MKKVIVDGREYFIRFRCECPHVHLNAEIVNQTVFKNLFCDINRDFCISNRIGLFPKNCPLEDAK